MRLNKEEILNIIRKNTLDVRITGDGRWIDQKCTPDVICAVADIVDSITSDEEKDKFESFDSKQVWFSDYSREYILDQFNKTDPTDPKAVAEYNKFFQQPLNLLAYANVLKKDKKGRANVYSVVNRDLLEYIGMSDRNALNFLEIYIREVLSQSGLMPIFDKFLSNQDSISFTNLKTEFASFCHQYTKIRGTLEPNRIFTKIINPLANKARKCGTSRGHLSKSPIKYSELMYNQENFRDIFADKPKEISRQVWLKEHPIQKSKLAKFKSDSEKAKKYVRRINDKYFGGTSEFEEAQGKATQMHHIFPQHLYREISGYTENIIALTPTQHYTQAHPNNNTRLIDPVTQELFLKAKANTIKYVTKHEEIEQIYSFDRFAHVLKVGFNTDKPEESYNTFETAINEISAHYSIDK